MKSASAFTRKPVQLDAQVLGKLELLPVEAEQEQKPRRQHADGLDGQSILELRQANGHVLDAQLAAEGRDHLLVLDIDERPRLHEERVEILGGLMLNVELGAEKAADADDNCRHEEIAHASIRPGPE